MPKTASLINVGTVRWLKYSDRSEETLPAGHSTVNLRCVLWDSRIIEWFGLEGPLKVI